MRNKVGVYICQCGSNISDYVDVDRVNEAVKNEDGVAFAKTTMFACADSVQEEMVKDIRENELDALVVASCSPKLHLHTFRNVALRAGLNPYNYVQVNIREQCSWAHSDAPEQATEKAISLVKGGIERARHSEALEEVRIEAGNSVAILGAGIAGMRAALALARMGTEVHLIEKNHFVGGRIPQWNKLFPADENAGDIIDKLYQEITENKNITLYTGAEITEKKGFVGNFEIEVRLTPGYIKEDGNPDDPDLQKAIDICPVEVDDPFNFNLTKRKAIYRNHPGQFPETVVIDDANCNHCNECTKVWDKIDLQQKAKTVKLNAGAILLTTGFDPYEPGKGEYGYREIGNVVTLQQFRRLIDMNRKELVFGNKTIKNITYIYCVGSRQAEGENKYCSRYCCTAAMHTAILAREKFPGIRNFHFTRGIRTYGKQETIYQDSMNNGDLFLQTFEEHAAIVERKGDQTVVKVKDVLTENMEVEVDADLVVLVTGMVPRKNEALAKLLKVPIGRDKFYNEIHPKLRPVETVIDGVYIAGTCQGPKNTSESVNSSLSAASKVSSLLASGMIELEPTLARIHKDRCEWCGKCLEICPYDAIRKTEFKGKQIAEVNEPVCKGCGMCLPVCPENAIDLVGYTDKEMESTIAAMAE